MNNKVIPFPLKLEPTEPVQLDLFGTDNFLIGKYSFLDVKETNQDEFIYYLKKLRFRIIIDLRIFPTFDRPMYNHVEVLSKINDFGILYFPAVYLKYTHTLHKNLSIHKRDMRDKSQQGPVLLLHERKQGRPDSLNRWKTIIEKNVNGAKELHPSTINRLETLFSHID